MSVEYNNEIETKILSHLDGWVLYTPSTEDDQDSTDDNTTLSETETIEPVLSDDSEVDVIDPFIDNVELYKNNPNKRILSSEVESFYNEALVKAYVLTNRVYVEDLTSIEESFFIDGVCLWTASDLWNKYNIRVNNEDLEDTYIQSYGGLLYNQALKTLNPFINQRVYTSTSLKSKESQSNSDITSNIWG